mgnify:CR=1 FL=1
MESLKSSQIRKVFLDFFQSKNHLIHPPSSLIPSNDPTLLLTNSGMAQFKSYFAGESEPPNKRITTAQKCFRATDIDEVGDSTHLTLFEMLGNFSFGDYFKIDACKWALELMTEHLGFEKDKIFISVHNDDNESVDIWKNIGIDKDKIYSFGDEDNWWGPAGDEGPCGPCSELHYYIGKEDPSKFKDLAKKNSWGPNKHEDFVELYNLVFTQFYHHMDGTRTELPNKNIDTGMGLERVATILQNKKSVYQTDLFKPLISKIENKSGLKWGSSSRGETTGDDKAIAVLAEHSRSATFLIADGVIPENTGRGYILRRLIRKAMRYGSAINLPENFLIDLSKDNIALMKSTYPELDDNKDFIISVLENECSSFSKTLRSGLKILESLIKGRKSINKQLLLIEKNSSTNQEFIQKLINADIKKGLISELVKKESDLDKLIGISQEDSDADIKNRILNINWSSEISYLEVSYLYDTLGFPFEVTAEFCIEQKLNFNKKYLDNLTNKLQKLSKSTSNFGGDKSINRLISEINAKKSIFMGYLETNTTSKIISIIDPLSNEVITKTDNFDELDILLDSTPFYPEGGGQVGDTGLAKSDNAQMKIIDTQSPIEGYIFHRVKILNGSFSVGDQIECLVDIEPRNSSKRNHTGTHMLHAALREILGNHVHQQGSLVSPHRLRFDFTHMKKLTINEIRSVESLLNSKIRANLIVKKHSTTYLEAIEQGAIAFFGDKYGKDVRTVEISNGSKFSYELCGGTHCDYTGEIGAFYIISETSISSGVRRIEAVTGLNAENFAIEQFNLLKNISRDMGTSTEDLPNKIKQLHDQVKSLKKEKESKDDTSLAEIANDLLPMMETINQIDCLITDVPNIDISDLRKIIDVLKYKFDGLIVLSTIIDKKIMFLVSISKKLTNKYQANTIVNSISTIIGGGGGGREEMAQAGGTDLSSMKKAFSKIRSSISK